MPITLRLMLWGDYAPKEPPAKGWYKNQKPYCSTDTTDLGAVGECSGYKGLTCRNDGDCPGGSTCGSERYCANTSSPSKSCSSDADCAADEGQCVNKNHFGNTPGACFAAPYEFQHVYTCNVKDLSAMPPCDASDPVGNAPCRRQTAGAWTCVYRPAAQIVDNWGWCNCTGDDCQVDNAGEYGEGCDPAKATPTKRPWTFFNGELRLAPTAKDRLKFEQLLAGGLLSTPSGGGFFYELYGAFSKFYKPVKFFFTGGFKL